MSTLFVIQFRLNPEFHPAPEDPKDINQKMYLPMVKVFNSYKKRFDFISRLERLSIDEPQTDLPIKTWSLPVNRHIKTYIDYKISDCEINSFQNSFICS